MGSFSWRYISYASQLFKEQDKRRVVINATGNALPKAVQVAEAPRRQGSGASRRDMDVRIVRAAPWAGEECRTGRAERYVSLRIAS